MLVNFVGSPGSGKTTLAARVFATLKEGGHDCEFIAEYARMHIARRKFHDGSFFNGLDDIDQHLIMQGQFDIEKSFQKTTQPNTIIIADSCPLLSLAYIKDHTHDDTTMIEQSYSSLDVVFYCPPLETWATNDHTRIHSQEESLEIDHKILDILKKIPPEKLYIAAGGIETRLHFVLQMIFAEVLKR